MTNKMQTRSNKDISVTLETRNVRLHRLNLELESLKNKNNKLQQQLRDLQAKDFTHNMPKASNFSIVNSNNIDMWLKDEHIQTIFQCFSTYASQIRKDIIFIAPNVTQVLKSSSLYDIMQVLSPLDFENMNLAFFAISDYDQCTDNVIFKNENFKVHQNFTYRGAHWSLLIFHRKSQTFYHLDSMKGANTTQAKLIAKNVNCDFKFKEIKTPQQTSNFECGLHVLIYSKQILDYVLNNVSEPLNKLLSLLTDDSDDSILRPNGTNDFAVIDNYMAASTVNKNETDSHGTIENNLLNRNTTDDFVVVNSKNKKTRKAVTMQDCSITCSNRFSQLPLCLDSSKSQATAKTITNDKPINGKKINDTSKRFISGNKLVMEKSPVKVCTNNCDSSSPHVSNEVLLTNTRNLKRKEFKTSKTVYKLKIIADSHGIIMRDITQEKCKTHIVFSSIKPNGKINNVLADVESETKGMTDHDFLVILGGTNDITTHLDANYIPNNIEKTIKSCSHTNFIVSAIPYRYDKPYLNKKIYQINVLLKKLCDKYYHCNFLSLYTINHQDYTKFGLHLNYFGKLKYSSLINQLIQDINNYRNKSAFIPVKITLRDFLVKQSFGNKQR